MPFSVDNPGATLIAEVNPRSYRANQHGLTLNITTLIDIQSREQHCGVEHIAVDTDDYSGTLARLRASGVRILEALRPTSGRHVCFLEAPMARRSKSSKRCNPGGIHGQGDVVKR